MLHDSGVLLAIHLLVPQLCLYQSALICKNPIATFFDFSKGAEDGSTVVPNEFRVSGGNPESRLVIPLELGILVG